MINCQHNLNNRQTAKGRIPKSKVICYLDRVLHFLKRLKEVLKHRKKDVPWYFKIKMFLILKTMNQYLIKSKPQEVSK